MAIPQSLISQRDRLVVDRAHVRGPLRRGRAAPCEFAAMDDYGRQRFSFGVPPGLSYWRSRSARACQPDSVAPPAEIAHESRCRAIPTSRGSAARRGRVGRSKLVYPAVRDDHGGAVGLVSRRRVYEPGVARYSGRRELVTRRRLLTQVSERAAARAIGQYRPGHAQTCPRPTTPVLSLEEVLRFDVTTAWVLSKWPRVWANLAELDMQGYRVPLVTGTGDADVAGSLTYYFNAKQRMARITFFGTTGDTRRLVAFLESTYNFKRIQIEEPNLYVYQVKSWTWGSVTSELRMRPASVVRSDVPTRDSKWRD